MGKTIEVGLDEHGRLVVPAQASKVLGLEPGMTLVVEPADVGDGVQLRVQATAPRLVKKNGVLVVAGEPACDLTTFVEEERERRIQDLLRQSGL